MAEGKQREMKFDEAIPSIIKELGEDSLDTYTLRDQFPEEN